MDVRLTARLLGDPRKPLGEQLGDAELEGAADALPRTEVVVDAGSTLAAALDKAVEAFREREPGDFSAAGTFVSFYAEEDAASVSHAAQRDDTTVTLVDHEGRATWNHPPSEVSYRDLLRAARLEAVVGDPTQPYVILEPGIGDGFLGTWEDVVAGWRVFWRLLEAADTVGGVFAVFVAWREHHLRRTEQLVATIERHAAEWSSRNAASCDVGRLVDAKPRTLPATASLLDLSVEEAEALLDARGWTQGPNGLWLPGTTESERAIQKIAHHLDYLCTSQESEIERDITRILEGRNPWDD